MGCDVAHTPSRPLALFDRPTCAFLYKSPCLLSTGPEAFLERRLSRRGKPKVTLFGCKGAPFGSRSRFLQVGHVERQTGRGDYQFLIIALSIIDNRHIKLVNQRLLSNLKSVAFLPKPCRLWRHFEGSRSIRTCHFLSKGRHLFRQREA